MTLIRSKMILKKLSKMMMSMEMMMMMMTKAWLREDLTWQNLKDN